MSRSPQPPSTRRERRAQARLEGARPRPRQARQQPASRRPLWQSPIVLVSAAAVIIGIAVVVFGRPSLPGSGGVLQAPGTVYPAGIADGTTLGKADAPAVMLLYADFQCPVCKTFVQQQLGRLVADFVSSGKLRIEAKDIRILDSSGSESLDLAVGAACAAEQNLYWQYHDWVYWNQGPERQGYHSRDFIGRVAVSAGLDVTKFNACYDRADVRQAVISATQASKSAGIQSTPTLVLNGQKIVGLQDYSALAGVIAAIATAPPSAAPAGS